MTYLAKAMLIALCLCAPTVAFAAQPTQPSGLVIRIYDTFGVRNAIAEEALSTSRTLLADAGVNVTWRECRTPGRPGAGSKDPCSDGVDARELIIRIMRTPRTILDPETLGYSYVDRKRGRGTLGTVLADRLRDLAIQLHASQGVLLGWAISHEICHLLLGTVTHSPDGVMRSHWSTNASAAEWNFTPAEALQMRLAVGSGPAAASLAVAGVNAPRGSGD